MIGEEDLDSFITVGIVGIICLLINFITALIIEIKLGNKKKKKIRRRK